MNFNPRNIENVLTGSWLYLKISFFRDLSLRSPIATFLGELVLPTDLFANNVVFSNHWDPHHMSKPSNYGGHGPPDIAESRIFLAVDGGGHLREPLCWNEAWSQLSSSGEPQEHLCSYLRYQQEDWVHSCGREFRSLSNLLAGWISSRCSI